MLTEFRGQGIDPDEFLRTRTGTWRQFESWIGDDYSVQGCPVDCAYCFFQLDGQTPIRPKILHSPELVIQSLTDVPTYLPDMPINFGSQTEVFSTKQTIEYYWKLLRLYSESDFPNPIVFITKRQIPDVIIDVAVKMKQKVFFFISYSGLAQTDYEPNTRNSDLYENFKKLKGSGLPGIHYWRPFVPRNSTPEVIKDILSFVSKYATCSVINGLKLNDGIRENIAALWPELDRKDFDFAHNGEFWPEGVRKYLFSFIRQEYSNYPVFFGNTPCAMTFASEGEDTRGIVNTFSCRKSNCQVIQRERCGTIFRKAPDTEVLRNAFEKVRIDSSRIRLSGRTIFISGEVSTGDIAFLKLATHCTVVPEEVGYDGGYNWANIREEGIVEIPWVDNPYV